MNRRTFMQTATTAAAGIAVTKKISYGKGTPDAAHLFFDPAELSRLRQSWSLPVFREFTAQLLAVDLAADEKFLKKELYIQKIGRAHV